MSRYGTTKARDVILGHARVNGWSVADRGLNLTLRRGSVAIAVRLSRNGEIFTASILAVRAIAGKDKLDQVVAEMNREP